MKAANQGRQLPKNGEVAVLAALALLAVLIYQHIYIFLILTFFPIQGRHQILVREVCLKAAN
jgi:hypothetical protein